MLRLAPPAWQAIAAHARQAAPEEACGILVGRREAGEWLALRAEPCPNVHSGDRRRHFLIDPERHLALQREARQQGLEIVAFYHSHPEGPCSPSEEDGRMAHPWAPMLIVALRAGDVAEARAWLWQQGAAREIPLSGAP
ncbi:MAG: M67 family metallopeptidase [Bryobacteraceae bacterium]|nr:M67 family metallopeptidase [Bryobacteraceae bacterium]